MQLSCTLNKIRIHVCIFILPKSEPFIIASVHFPECRKWIDIYLWSIWDLRPWTFHHTFYASSVHIWLVDHCLQFRVLQLRLPLPPHSHSHPHLSSFRFCHKDACRGKKIFCLWIFANKIPRIEYQPQLGQLRWLIHLGHGRQSKHRSSEIRTHYVTFIFQELGDLPKERRSQWTSVYAHARRMQ